MSKIIGNQDVINRAKNARSADKISYISWDLISELPDEYEPVISEFIYDPENLPAAFSHVGNDNYMATPETHYKIAELSGIKGEKSFTSEVVQLIDYSLLTMNDEPKMMKILVGYKTTKISSRLQDDGTFLTSDECTSEYNAWNRCVSEWTKEEANTDGYAKCDEKGCYKYYYNNTQKTGYVKYNNKYKRKAHFQKELIHALAQTQTKAHCKSIRVLAGMPTAYNKKDLTSGSMFFCKIRRSKKILQLETAKRLASLSNSTAVQTAIGPAMKATFKQSAEIEDEKIKEDTLKPMAVEIVEPEPEKNNRDILIEAFNFYLNEDGIIADETQIETIKKMNKWLSDEPLAESNTVFWNKAIKNLQSIEKTIPENFRFQHSLY